MRRGAFFKGAAGGVLAFALIIVAGLVDNALRYAPPAYAVSLTNLFFHNAGTPNISTGANWCTLTNGLGTCGSVPTAANQCVFDLNSGNATADAAETCGGLTTTGYAGTFTHNAGVTVTLQPAANTGSSVDFTGFVGHYSQGNASTSLWQFGQTQGTGSTETFTTGGLVIAVTQSGNGNAKWTQGDLLHASAMTLAAAGSWNDGGFGWTLTGTYSRTSAGSGALTVSGPVTSSATGNGWNDSATGTATTWTGGITFTGSLNAIFGPYAYGALTPQGTGTTDIVSATGTSFTSLTDTVSGSTIGQRLQITGTTTVSGACNLTGNSALYTLAVVGWSNQTNGQPAVTQLNCGSNGSGQSNTNFEGINSTGATLSGTQMGNVDGNSGNISFAAPITCYIVVPSSGLSSVQSNYATTSGGSTQCPRVPMPQDTVIADLNSGFNNGGSLTSCFGANSCNWVWDLQFLPKWDFSAINVGTQFDGATDSRCPYVGTPNTYLPIIAADVTLFPCFLQFSFDRGQYAIQPVSHVVQWMPQRIRMGSAITLRAGATGGLRWVTNSVDGTNITIIHAGMTLNAGVYNDNGNIVQIQSSLSISPLSNSTLTYTQGGILQLNGSSTVLTCATAGLTINQTGIIEIGGNTGTATVAGGGCNLGNLTANSSDLRLDTVDCLTFCSSILMNSLVDNLTVTGANTFGALTLNTSTAGSVTDKFPASTTQTVTELIIKGISVGNVVNFNSATGGTTFTTATSNALACFASIKDSTVTSGTAYGSTNVSNNSGWTFDAVDPCPTVQNGGPFPPLGIGIGIYVENLPQAPYLLGASLPQHMAW